MMSVAHDCYLYCHSGNLYTDSTSGLHDMLHGGLQVPGSRVGRNSCCIRCESFLAPHLRGTHPDRPPDFLAFSVIVHLVVRSNVNKDPMSSLLKAIVRDATSYFLFIFTSHLVLMLFLLFASVSILS